MVVGSLKANMIETFDLGLNVSPMKFITEAIDKNASIIGISSMMVHTAIGEDGPKMHAQKSGTPTMGGIAIIAAILITGFPSIDTVREAHRSLAFDYIVKPFDNKTVSEVIKKITS